MAQSSVTISGVLDAGYNSFAATTGAGVKYTQKGIGYSADDTSRWQVKAVEDIGGGIKAGTTIESTLAPNPRTNFGYDTTGAADVTGKFGLSGQGNTVDAQKIGDRILTVDLTIGKHSFNFGNQAQPTRSVAVGFQADGSNLIGNLVGNDATLTGRIVAANYSYAVGNGLNVGGAVTANTKQQDSVDATSRTGNGWALTSAYAQGPVAAGAVYSKQTTNDAAVPNTDTTVTKLSSQLLTPVVTTLAAPAKNVETTALVAGVSYDLSVAKLYGQYMSVKNDDTMNASKNDSKRHATSVGVRVPFGAAWAFAQMSSGANQITGANNTSPIYEGKWTGYSAGVKYELSKRTVAYAGIGRAKYGVADGQFAKAAETAVGLKHAF